MGPFSFLNPALLLGAAAISVPIAIHLFSRRRHRLVEWAAMDFLFSAHRRSRKRVKMEHWLILLLRCLAILLLTLLVARPVYRPRTQPGSTTHLPSPAEHIIVLDDSLSMSAIESGQAPAARANDHILAWLDFLQAERPADVVTILRSSQPARPMYRAVRPTPDLVSAIEHDLREVKPTAGQPDREELYTRLIEMLDRPGIVGTTTLTLLSDLRAADWAGQTNLSRLAVRQLERMKASCTRFALVDCANADAPDNAALAGLRAESAVVDGIPTTYRISVCNYGTRPVHDMSVTFGPRDGPKRPYRIATIEPGATETLLCNLTLRDRTWAALEARIDDDALSADNVRRLATAVQPYTRVMIVRPGHTTPPPNDPVYFIQMALAPPGPIKTGHAITTTTIDSPLTEQLDDLDVLIACDAPTDFVAENRALLQWVRDGGVLICMPDPTANPNAFNRAFCGEKAESLLPAKLTALSPVSFVDADGFQITLTEPVHPVVSVFAGNNNPFLARVRLRRWWHTHPMAPVDATVLCRLNDPKHSPFILSHRIGKGVAYLVTSSPGTANGNWVSDPSFVVVMQQLATQRRTPNETTGNITAGDPFDLPIDLNRYAPSATLATPDIESTKRTIHAGSSAYDDAVAFRIDDTRQQGWYTLTLKRSDGRPEERHIAVNPQPLDSDTRRADPTKTQRALRALGIALITDMQDMLTGSSGIRHELWKPVCWLLLVVLAIEHILSWWFLRRRTGTEPTKVVS